MVLNWDRNSVLTQANYINPLQFFGGVVQENESNMGFCCRWGVSNPRDDRAERNRGYRTPYQILIISLHKATDNSMSP